MQDNIIFLIGCFIVAGLMCEVVWSVFLYVVSRLEYYFYHRYLDKVYKSGTIEE